MAGNPLNAEDPSGLLFGLDNAIAAGVGFVAGAATTYISEATSGNHQVDWGDVAIAGASGAAAGAAFTECGVCAGAVAGAVTDAGQQLYHKHTADVTKIDPWSVAGHAVLGGVGGLIGDLNDGAGQGSTWWDLGLGIVSGSLDPYQSVSHGGSDPYKNGSPDLSVGELRAA